MVVNSHTSLIWWFLFLSITTLLAPPTGISATSCNDGERRSLLTFKAGLTDRGGHLSSWSDTEDPNCCNWEGVSCSNQTGRVLKLNLRNPIIPDRSMMRRFNLEGKIGSSLLGLKYLEYLDLSVNNFSGGTIPKFFGSLQNLRYLNLSYSFLTGLVPPHLGNLSSLLYIDLGGNSGMEVEGLQWLWGLSSLKHLNLCRVSLEKAGPDWLKAFNMLPSLLELHLCACHLSNLPPLIDYHSINFTSLSTLDLSSNHFHSSLTLPPWLYNLSGLVNLNLRGSSLQSVVISDEIGKLLELQQLDLSSNFIRSQLPVALGSLVKLVILDLSTNSFWGSIPRTFGKLTSLRILDLSWNTMNGTITEAIGQLLELEVMDLFYNPWQGSLTEAHFEKHTKLRRLDLLISSKGNLVMDVRQDWLPPFTNIRYVMLDGVKMRSKGFPAWIHTLHHLERLSLMGCSILGYIPTEFWKSCPNITVLDLSHNAISIRTSFTNLEALLPLVPAKLKRLHLQSNSFSGDGGEIPSNIGQLAPALGSLDLSSNFISGKIPLSVCEIKSLWNLILGNNLLAGEISQHSWEQMESLRALDLSGNNLVGKIPKSIGSLNYLELILLNDNHLESEVPTFTNSTSLQILDLGGNNLTGKIPPNLGENKLGLVILRLRGNKLSGTIPVELCLLSGLRFIDLAHNNFQGIIPWCLGNLSSSNEDDVYSLNNGISMVSKGKEYELDSGRLYLVHLVDFSDNNLFGKIPESLMNLTAMHTLNLSMNQLTGEIPTNIGELRMLESLDLSSNQLSGQIPPSFSTLSSLSYLNLSHNNLSGKIPFSRQLQTLDESSSFDGNPLLCGLPLPTKCPGDGTTEGEGEEKLDRGKRGFDLDKWGLILSVVLGFVVGFWGVCGSLVIKPSLRQVYFRLLEDVKDKIVVTVIVSIARMRRTITR